MEQNLTLKREKEKQVVSEMVALYCHKQHHTRGAELCPQCAAVLDYARARTDHCPFMESKTFCVNCSVHCYKPDMREKIREIMRFSGPRMLFHRPGMALSHAFSMLREKHNLKQNRKDETSR